MLAGGESRRFGSDKALATHSRRPFVQIAYDALAPHCAEVLIATGSTSRAYPVPARTVLDSIPDGGPLAGLAAGLAVSPSPWLLAVAVDLPHLTPDALVPLLTHATDTDAVVALDADGHRQPVCALWRCATVRPIVETRIQSRQLALFGLMDALVIQEVPLPPGTLRNVNASEDLTGGSRA